MYFHVGGVREVKHPTLRPKKVKFRVYNTLGGRYAAELTGIGERWINLLGRSYHSRKELAVKRLSHKLEPYLTPEEISDIERLILKNK